MRALALLIWALALAGSTLGFALGIAICVRILDKAPGHGVDTEADLARVDAELRRRAQTDA